MTVSRKFQKVKHVISNDKKDKDGQNYVIWQGFIRYYVKPLNVCFNTRNENNCRRKINTRLSLTGTQHLYNCSCKTVTYSIATTYILYVNRTLQHFTVLLLHTLLSYYLV
jgi:hypothetical protein